MLDDGGWFVADPPATGYAIGEVVVLDQAVRGQPLVEADLRRHLPTSRHQRPGHELDVARLLAIDDRAPEAKAAHASLGPPPEKQPAEARMRIVAQPLARGLVDPTGDTDHARILIRARQRLEQARLERAIVIHEDDDLAGRRIDSHVALQSRTRIARHVAHVHVRIARSRLAEHLLGRALRIAVDDDHLAVGRERAPGALQHRRKWHWPALCGDDEREAH